MAEVKGQRSEARNLAAYAAVVPPPDPWTLTSDPLPLFLPRWLPRRTVCFYNP